MSDKTTCTCTHCVNACESKPGWFMPEQIPALLEHFQVKTIKELLPKIGIDFLDHPADGPLVLAPNIVGNNSHVYPLEPRGVCVFLKEGRCSIHAVKPFECAELLHGDSHMTVGLRHAGIGKAWRGRQELEEFRKDIPEPDAMEMLNFMFSQMDKLSKGIQ
jgi:Fe-S-cluster containining protein